MLTGQICLYTLYLSLVGGVIYYAFLIWKRYHHRFLYYLFIYIMFFYIYIFLSYNGKSFASILNKAQIPLVTTYMIIAVVTTPLLLIGVYFLFRWQADLLGVKFGKGFKAGFWTLQLIIMVGLFSMFIVFFRTENAGLISPYVKGLGYAVNSMFLLSYLFLFIGSKKVENPARKELARNLGLSYFGIFSLQFALSDFIRLPFYGNPVLNYMFMFGMLFLLNSIPLAYIHFFLNKHRTVLGVLQPDVNEIESAVNKYDLTEREKEVIELIISGLSNKDIGRELYISIKTVKNHISSIYMKTAVRNRVQLSNLIRSRESGGRI